MKSFSSIRTASNIEVGLIAITLFCLPLFEAPKNGFGILFVSAWVFFSLRCRSIGRSAPFDVPIAGLAVILWLAPIFSDFRYDITPMNSALRWTLLALFVLTVSRLDYTRGQLIVMLVALMMGGAAAVIESFWVWNLNGKQYPEFRSVGHVNHSSMYSLIPLASGIGAMWMRYWWLKALGMAAAISTLAFLPPSQSLVGAVAVFAILVVGLTVLTVRRWSLRGVAVSVCVPMLLVVGALAMPSGAGFRQELVIRLTGDDIFSERDKILNSALVTWNRHPLLGTGWFSFGAATAEEEVRATLAESGREYDPAKYAHHAHGHNLWTTMLIERGLLGVGLVSVLLLLYFWIFLPLAMRREQLDPIDRGVVVTALLVAVGFAVAGLGNTTMMNEHGHAGMALISICYGYLRGRGLVGKTLPVCS